MRYPQMKIPLCGMCILRNLILIDGKNSLHATILCALWTTPKSSSKKKLWPRLGASRIILIYTNFRWWLVTSRHFWIFTEHFNFTSSSGWIMHWEIVVVTWKRSLLHQVYPLWWTLMLPPQNEGRRSLLLHPVPLTLLSLGVGPLTFQKIQLTECCMDRTSFLQY